MTEQSTKQETANLPSVEPVKSRIPYHPRIEEKFGIDDVQWKALVESVFSNAKSMDSVALALSYCKARNLDVMKKPVHIVPIWDSKSGGYIDTVWPSLNLYRTEATRTGTYAGIDDAEFGPTISEKLSGTVGKSGDRITKEVSYPEWCQVTIYRMVQGKRVAFSSPKVRWKEYYAPNKRNSQIPNEQWERRPFYMIEKVAESLALRRAFPEECPDPTAEEMRAAADPVTKDITPKEGGFAAKAKAARPEPPAPEPEEPETIEDAEVLPPENDDHPAEDDQPHQHDGPDPDQTSFEYSEGRTAAENGAGLNDCPYEMGTQLWVDWAAAWNSVKDKA